MENKKIKIDLLIIVLVSILTLFIYNILFGKINIFLKDTNINIILRLLVIAFFQYSLAGLGITIVCLYRKEPFTYYGLNSKNILKSIVLCILCFLPLIIFHMFTKGFISIKYYLPFKMVSTTNEVLASSFPINVIGMIITGIAWGFFEGFNYVVISDKINKLYTPKNKWLDLGAIICSILCILIHGMIGVTPEDIIEMICIFILIYGMLIVRKITNNAWGCVFIFIFLWNAF